MPDKKQGEGRVFVLGDSRTGTLSLHRYFIRNGISSLHYYMRQAKQTDPIHADLHGNLLRFIAFLEATDVRAFCDYPTRAFYRELYATQPEAKFILTTRSSTDVWTKSMSSFLSRFNIKADLDELKTSYESGNREISDLFQGSRQFLVLNIDADNEQNSEILSIFVGSSGGGGLVRENASDDIDTRVLSKRHKLFGGSGLEEIDLIQSQVSPSKSIISEYSWAFLVNDTNAFFDYQFGRRAWNPQETTKAVSIVSARIGELAARKASYLKFIVPEKSVIYREYLPRSLDGLETVLDRPAPLLSRALPGSVHYLESWMRDAKSYGLLYFRGDTHTNWVGAWHTYRYIADELARLGLLADAPVDFSMMLPEVAGYDGDLVSQLDAHLSDEWSSRWGLTRSAGTFETTIRLSLRPERRIAMPVDVPGLFGKWFKRATLAYERPDRAGLRAVVFRDSTADYVCDLLAQHFSRSIFIWHEGQVVNEVLEVERPDVVLHIMAERFICMYPTFVPTIRVT